jgi:hypothetical protein
LKEIFMIRVAVAVAALLLLQSTNAQAAGVNCSYDVCLKLCAKNGGSAGCSKWCTDTLAERRRSGQCK